MPGKWNSLSVKGNKRKRRRSKLPKLRAAPNTRQRSDFSQFDAAVDDLKALPETILDEVSERIAAFNNQKSDALNREYIEKEINWITGLCVVTRYRVTEERCFWRVRRCEPGEVFAHTDDLKYRLSGAPFGRMNRSGESIFYAASSPETAFAESRLKFDECFHLTEYRVAPGTTFYCHVTGELDALRRTGETVTKISEFRRFFEHILSQLKPDVALAVQLADAFLVDRLGRKGSEDEYRVTATIAAEFLRASPLDCLFYPSVEHAGGFNYAVKPFSYDRCVRPTQASINAVFRAYGYGAYKMLNISSNGPIPTLGQIPWPNSEGMALYRSSRDGRWKI